MLSAPHQGPQALARQPDTAEKTRRVNCHVGARGRPNPTANQRSPLIPPAPAMACSLSAFSFFNLPGGLGAGLAPSGGDAALLGRRPALGGPPSCGDSKRAAPARPAPAAADRRACPTCARPLSARCSFCAAPDAFVCDGCCAVCDGCGKGACGACQAARFAACERCAYSSCDECRIQPGACG